MDITPELQAAIDAAVETATKALKDKNTQLIGEVRDLKSAKTAAEDEAATAREEAASKAGNVEELRKELDGKYGKQIEKITGERDAALGQVKTFLIDNNIQKALVDNNVPAHFHEALMFQFKAQAALKDGAPMLGDVEINEGIKAYFASDAGKHFIPAPANVGSGANGVKSAVASGDGGFTKDTWTLTQYSAMMRTNPEQAKTINESLGSPF